MSGNGSGRTQLLCTGAWWSYMLLWSLLFFEVIDFPQRQSQRPNNRGSSRCLQTLISAGGRVCLAERSTCFCACCLYEPSIFLLPSEVFLISFWILSRELPGLGSIRLITLEAIASGFLEHHLPMQVSQPCSSRTCRRQPVQSSDPDWKAAVSLLAVSGLCFLPFSLLSGLTTLYGACWFLEEVTVWLWLHGEHA